MFEEAHDIILMVDRQGNILDINQRAERLTGFTQSELRQMNVFQDLIVPEDQPTVRRMLEDVIEGRRREYEVRWRTKHGDVVHFSAASTPRFSPGGEFISTLSTLRDITARLRAGDALSKYASRLEIQHEIDEAILAARFLQEIADAVLQRIKALVPCQGASINLLNFEARELTIYATDVPGTSNFARGRQIPFAVITQIDEKLNALRMGQILVTEDITMLPESASLRQAVAEGRRSFISAPLRVKGDLIGLLNMWAYEPGRFGAEDVDIIREVADSLSVAIAQVWLFEEVSEARDRLQLLSWRLVEAQEAERRRLARELHDQMGQNLAALKITLRVLRSQLPARTAVRVASRLEDALQLVEQTIERLRFMVTDLRPMVLDDYGLAAGLQAYAQQFSKHTGMDVQVQAVELEPRLPVETETALFRIAQEALINAAQHSGARQASVILEEAQERVRLIVGDEGVGFDPTKVGKSGERRGLGLISMHERAEAVGGHLRIESKPDQGTRIIADVPR